MRPLVWPELNSTIVFASGGSLSARAVSSGRSTLSRGCTSTVTQISRKMPFHKSADNLCHDILKALDGGIQTPPPLLEPYPVPALCFDFRRETTVADEFLTLSTEH